MELSLAEVQILKSNTMHLGGLSFDSDLKKGPMIASYSGIKYGEGVSLVDRIYNVNGSRLVQKEINLCKMSKSVVIIAGQKCELLEASKHIFVIDTSFHNDVTMDTNTNYVKSGIFLQCLAVSGDREVCEDVAWDNDLLPIIKHCKNNILGTGKLKHLNSNGDYCSYGKISIYWIFDNSSVEQYSNKKVSNLQKQSSIDKNAIMIKRCLLKKSELMSRILRSLFEICLFYSHMYVMMYIDYRKQRVVLICAK